MGTEGTVTFLIQTQHFCEKTWPHVTAINTHILQNVMTSTKPNSTKLSQTTKNNIVPIMRPSVSFYLQSRRFFEQYTSPKHSPTTQTCQASNLPAKRRSLITPLFGLVYIFFTFVIQISRLFSYRFQVTHIRICNKKHFLWFWTLGFDFKFWMDSYFDLSVPYEHLGKCASPCDSI